MNDATNIKLDNRALASAKASLQGSGIRWSSQQEDIFNAGTETSANLCVIARAGSGKTTTAVELAKRLSGTVNFLAFNKVIAAELGSRLGGGGRLKASTFHSLGLRVCKTAFGSVTVDKDKTRKIMSHELGREFFGYHSRIAGAVAFAKNANLYRPVDAVGTESRIRGYVLANALDDEKMSTEKLTDAIMHILDVSLHETKVIDFDDMVWFPMIHGLNVPKSDTCIGDEAQDMNPGQLYLATRAGHRVILIGDDRQAIYAWRGAGYGVLDDAAKALSATVLPLSVTYRCGKRIVEHVQPIVPDFTAHESNGEGTVEYLDPSKMYAQAKPGDFVLSRTNAALIKVALALGVSGTPVIIAGGLDKQIKGLLRRSKADSLEELANWLAVYDNDRQQRLADQDEALQQHNDLVGSVELLMGQAEDLHHLQNMVEQMFSNGARAHAVYCSTCHRAKGLEADTVWVLPNFTRDGIGNENVYYVACTRAIKRLVKVTSD